jgi:hypothetical protein
MGTRGRKSSAELATKPPLAILSERRPSPPADLTEAEGAVWSDTAGCMPAGWISKAQMPLLTAYCRHVVRASFLAEQIAKFKPEWLKEPGGLERLDKFLQMADRETKALNACARSLRLTHQSQYTARTGARMAAKGAEPRPWDPM